jgi:Putative serine esterase (DUF676)
MQDGVDQAGIRLSKEVIEVVGKHKSLEEISFVGMSMGGLICRYAIGLLYKEDDATIAGLKPNSFFSFATPHLGARGHVAWMVENAWSLFPLIKPSCDHFFLRDTDHGKKLPLLVEMTLPDSNFFKGLAVFRKRVLYGNVEKDHRTSYQSGTIWPYEKKQKKQYTYHPNYPTIVLHEEEEDPLVPFYSEESGEWIAAQNLLKLSWVRVGCHFDGWFAKLLNHTNIVVCFEKMNAIGKTAVAHFVDSFSDCDQ